MPDINSYSLSLLLDLQSNAPEVLDDVSTRLDQINEQILQIADNYTTALGGAAESMATATEQIASSLGEVQQSLDKGQPILESMRDLQEERKKGWEEELDHVENIHESMEKIAERTGDWRDVLDPVARHIDSTTDGVADLGDGLDRAGDGVGKVARGFFDVFLGIEAIKTAFAEFLELEEQFIHSHYRLYGAQEQIVRQVSDISDQYDLLRGTANEAMKSLAISLRVPREELGKYVAQVSMFHRATGASITQTSEWIRSMTLAGFTARDTERSLGRMVSMMRQAGFTTEQINKYLQQQIDVSARLATRFGPAGVEAYDKMTIANAAMMRQVHGSVEAMQSFNKALVSNIALEAMALGMHNLSAEMLAGMTPAEQYTAKLQSGMFGVIKMWDRVTAHLSPAQVGPVLDGLSTKFGLASGEAEKLVQGFRELEAQGIVDWKTMQKEMGPTLDALNAQAEMMKQYGDAMNTVKARWESALRPLFNSWISLMIALKPVMLFIIDLVGVLADVLAFLINTLAAIINPIATFKRHLEGVNEAGEKTVGFFKRLGTGVINFAQALPGLIFGIAALVGLYFGLRLIAQLFVNWVNQMRPANLMALATAFLAMGASILMMATALAIVASLGLRGAVALVILSAAMAGMAAVIIVVGKAAQNNNMALQKLAVTMLAVGAAALMVAGAVWIVADAMKMMASQGLGPMIGAGVAVVGILAAITAVLVILSSLGAPIVPIMLAVGVAFLMMGAAIWLAAAAFEMIVDSFAKLGKSATEIVENAGALSAAVAIISSALLTLAAVGYVGAAPLLALGIALLVLGAAAVMITGAFEAAVKAIKAFADIENVKDAVAGLEVAIESMMRTMAEVSYRWRWYLPLMLVGAGVLLAVGVAAWGVAKAIGVMADALEKFGDMGMIIAALKGVAVAMGGLALIALVISPALKPLILMGVAMVAIGAGAWLMAEAMSTAVGAIGDFAAITEDEILQIGRDLVTFGRVLADAAASILSGSLLMLQSAMTLGVAMAALGVAMWLVPIGRLKELGVALGVLGDNLKSLGQIESITLGDSFGELAITISSALGAIEEQALRADTIADSFVRANEAIARALAGPPEPVYGELAITISSALDEIEEQALRADTIADSFVQMNEAIAHALAGPPEPVYSDVANALRDKMDAIEEQAARAEAVYAPIEGIAEQAELALAMSGEPAPEAFAEPVVGGLAPAGEEEDAMAFSNYKNLRRQTELLEEIKEGMPIEAIKDAFGKVGELKDVMVEYVGEHPVATTSSLVLGGSPGFAIGLAVAAFRHAGEE